MINTNSSNIKVRKRDCEEVDFDITKITNAIKGAYIDVYPCDFEIKFNKQLPILLGGILGGLQKLMETLPIIDVENISDIVESNLKIVDKKVYTSFKEYREKRSKNREGRDYIQKKLDKILRAEDVQNSNANLDEKSGSGRKFEAAGLIMKKFALDHILSREVANAHKYGQVYQHDLDNLANGIHNCANINFDHLVNDGFKVRNIDVRPAKSIQTAFQLAAVCIQLQSQCQFGGCAIQIDYACENAVHHSFNKAIDSVANILDIDITAEKLLQLTDGKPILDMKINSEFLEAASIGCDPDDVATVLIKALELLDKEGKQAAEALYHNLNTLQSRPGSQLPFSSLNLGRNKSIAGKIINEWILNASLQGVGKYHLTPIFPITCVNIKKGENKYPKDPNYNVKKLAISSLCRRIYPNIVNGDYSQHQEDPNDPNTIMLRMGKSIAHVKPCELTNVRCA